MQHLILYFWNRFELITYFSLRMISAETLRRNAVMQRNCDNQVVIAFPYGRNGTLVSCKYRGVNKIFWQERNTEKIFYGLDDIKHAGDIIIVEGEMDKLAMEEAGYANCVSVPDGAPPKVSKELPSEEKIRVTVTREFLESVERNVHSQHPAWRVDATELDRICGSALLVSYHTVFLSGNPCFLIF